MSYPKISIITPSFNQDQYLEQTILSVIGQNYPNLEYIIIDGGSSDNSVEIIKKYKNNLTYWVSEPDKGQSHALNKGLNLASGDILAWLNSDDLYMPGIFNSIYKQFKVNEPSIFLGECIHFKENVDSLVCWGSNVTKSNNRTDLSIEDYVIQPSTFWTKETWNKIGPLREDLHYVFDWEWYLRGIKMGVPLVPLKIPISLYRIHSTHKTALGGIIRQKEISGIYNINNPRIGLLYAKLCNEKLKTKSQLFRIFYKVSKIIRIKSSFGSFLKIIKGLKYSGYSVNEINQVLSMR